MWPLQHTVCLLTDLCCTSVCKEPLKSEGLILPPSHFYTRPSSLSSAGFVLMRTLLESRIRPTNLMRCWIWACQHRADCCHLSAGEIPAWKGEPWFENRPRQHLTLPCCGCPYRGKLTLAGALCVLANPAGRQIPRDSWQLTPEQPEAALLYSGKPGAETQSPAYIAPLKAWASLQWGWCQGSCLKGNPDCSEQHLLWYCQTPQDLGSSVSYAAGGSTHLQGLFVKALPFTALFIQESQVGLVLFC